jgi:anti-sigma regulatory factor (Ser/Thr protein kinase)
VPYRWSLDDTTHAIGAARRDVRHALEARHVPKTTVDVVELLTSEVITNAVVHARSPRSVELFVSDRQVRVAVEDGTTDPPEVHHVEPTALTGRGMTLVEELSAIWGSDPTPGGGKWVWFEVPFSYG